ncbi:MAG: biopolymer transporter ExbD [Hirschia sp.]|nr:biopolymer transporter ExbD [Hirschia sp.]MBF18218.1 biopolymer transporter ExbD [Hirschia sp.]
MRKRRNRASDEAEVDMTPMLDVVFILLIFFIVTSTFLSEVGFDLTPPPQNDGPPPKPVPAVNIYIDESNAISVDGRPVDIKSVRANIERRKAENPEISVVILADGDAQNRYVVEVFDQAKRASIENVNVLEAQ